MTQNLISGHITSGVKQAGTCHWRFYGTREVIVVLRVKSTSAAQGYGKTMAADQMVVVKKS